MKRTTLLPLFVLAASACQPDAVTMPVEPGDSYGRAAAIVINGITDVDPGYAGWSEGFAINDAGRIVGWRNTQQNALYSNTNFQWDPAGGVTQLFFQSDWSAGNDINARGQVAGTHAYVGWFFDPSGGSSVVAPTPSSATGLVCKYGVNAINDAGVLAGSQDNCSYSQPYFWNSVSGHLALIPVGGAFATAINNHDRVLFSTFAGAGGYAAIYEIGSGAIQRLPSLAGGETRGNDINDAGQVVGYSMVGANARAFLWDPAGGIRDLGTLGGAASAANGINNLGQVVGWSLTASGAKHAFAWDPVNEYMQDLGTIAGDSSVANDINDYGQATGWSTTAYGMHHAVIWEISFAPPRDLPFPSVAVLSVGDFHSCVLSTQGTMSCWGNNYWGNTTVPNEPFVAVSTGNSSTCGITPQGAVKCWGYGHPPGGVTHVPPAGRQYVQVDAGWVSHVCALTDMGDADCWGSNSNGQLNIPAGTYAQVQAGQSYSCTLDAAGQIACRGYNSHGQTQAPQGAFERMSLLIAHGCAIRANGSVQCWGFNDFGQTNSLPGTYLDVSAGVHHSCGITAAGEAVCWGTDEGNSFNAPPGPYIEIGSGWKHNCAFTPQRKVRCWGNNTYGQLNVPAAWQAPPDPGATPPGSNVTVSPIDGTTGQPAPVQLTFDNVTAGGQTTVTSATVGQGGPPSPGGFRLGNPPTWYDVQTTATFSGSVTLCFDYSGASYGNESKLKLLHYENGAWTNVTTSLDAVNDIICGTVTSLSPFLVAEENAAPVVTGIALPAAPVALGTAVTVTASFTDANPADTHTAGIAWDDGSTSAAGVTESAGAGSATGSRTYAAAGVYTVVATVSDGDLTGSRSSTSDQPAYIVVYDPSGSYVTGGGWFDSPAGACVWSGCAQDGGTTGKASFGFVSRYRPGATVPTGNTEFHFKAGGLTFRSTSYQWLVVAGARAQYKGEGQIQGAAGTFGFLITAIDGALPGGGGSDRFRIKLWDAATNVVVYDNQMGSLEDSNAATAIGGGSIVIHRQ